MVFRASVPLLAIGVLGVVWGIGSMAFGVNKIQK
jgi:hypothetical protein